MKERPIIFSGPMVRSVLSGAKSQTRRVIKPQPKGHVLEYVPHGDEWLPRMLNRCEDENGNYSTRGDMKLRIRCPYGQPGDRLWVREAWVECATIDSHLTRTDIYGYKADYSITDVPWKWRPSIHMTRDASRLTLEIMTVRVERLQDISCADAIAEGIVGGAKALGYDFDFHVPGLPIICGSSARAALDAVWQHINGGRGFLDNPWVWAITFKRVDAQ